MKAINLELIKIPQLHDFTAHILKEFSNEQLIQKADNVAAIIIATLRKKKLVNDNSHQSFVDVMLTAALIHNVFDVKEDWTNAFQHRKQLSTIATEYGIDEQIQEAIFSTIEAQLGDDMPVNNCRPKPGTPTEIFATSVWFAENYLNELSEAN